MKKLCIALLLCCFMGSTAYAVTYETFTDKTTGRTIEYFDLDGDTTRNYVTQNAWFANNKALIVRKESNKSIYKYNTETHTAEAMFGGLEADNGAVVGPDDTVYAVADDGHLYAQTPSSTSGSVELTMTLPFGDGYDTLTTDDDEWGSGETSASATGASSEDGKDYTAGGLTFRWATTPSRYRHHYTRSVYRGGKYARSTFCQSRNNQWKVGKYVISEGATQRYGTQMLFRVDNSLIPTTQRNVVIEFDYFDDNDTDIYGQADIEVKYLKYNDGSTPTVGTKTVALTGTGTWKTAKVKISDADFSITSGSGFTDCGDLTGNVYHFQIGMGGNRGGFASTYVKVYTADIMDLGDSQHGYHPHVSANGDLSLTTNSNTLVIYEADKQQFATTDVWVKSAHCIINPVYPHLVLYTQDNLSTERTMARIRLFNRNEVTKGALYRQHSSIAGDDITGEAIGHENWTPDGEYIVAVKYDKDTNVGKNGIIRMDKNGENVEYINDDYDYWHCSPSPDGRWIVADTLLEDKITTVKNGTNMQVGSTNIVLIDTKTGKSYLVARERAFEDDPCQPHVTFSQDGKKVTFGIAYKYTDKYDFERWETVTTYTYGVAIADVSDIVNDGQLAEPAAPTDFQISPLTVAFDENTGKNKVTASLDNIDGEKRALTVFAAVYDNTGKMVSFGKRRYNSKYDETLETEFDGTVGDGTVKFFIWNDDNKPLENNIGTIKKLRAAKVSKSEVVLSWQHESDIPVVKYEIYRGDSKIGETPFTMYRDKNLTQNTQYTYYVRPVYDNNFYLDENGAISSANSNNLNLGISSVLGNPSKNYGLTFWENNNLALDSYTEAKNIDGVDCRKARKVTKGETDEQGNKRYGSDYNGNFYFKCNRDVVKSSDNKVLVGVRYYDNREGVGLSIQYKNNSGSTSNATIVTKTGTDTWKTATLVLNDVQFDDSTDPYSGYDFRLQGGYDMYISRVWVIPLDENGNIKSNDGLGGQIAGPKAGVKVTTNTASTTLPSSSSQYAEWTTSTNNNLTANKTGNANSGTAVWIAGTMNDWFKFNVSDGYLWTSNNMVWIEVTYQDNGTNQIYVYYNNCDPSASTDAQKASKAADTVITCTDTGEWKTAIIPIIDAEFTNKLDSTYDFAIRASGDDGAVINRVRVVGY